MDALAGYRVVDLGSAWAAPMAAHLLADMGAEVIKVESRAKMDGMRLGRPMIGEDAAGGDEGRWPELQPVFHGLNRNKQSVTLNLKEPEGIDLLRGLIARSDVVIDNFSPGVMDRLGLDYPSLRRLRPDIVVVAMPAAGNTGPLRDVIAYAPIVLALSGLMSLVGYEDGALVGELQSAWSDAVAGLHAAMAAAAALRHRTRTGRGQYIEAAQLESTVSWLGEAVMDVAMNGRTPAPIGNTGVGVAPHGVYPCAGGDRWISIAVASEEEWGGLCDAARRLGSAPWTRDRRFADSYRRLRHREALDEALRGWTVGFDAEELTAALQAEGVAAFPVMNIEDQFLDPHFRERGAWVEIEHPMAGAEWLYGVAWRLSRTPGRIASPAPLLGQHNERVLGGLLGTPAQELARLEASGAVS